MKRRVVLVDDHELLLAGVRAELGDAVEVVGEAGERRRRGAADQGAAIPTSSCSTSTSRTASGDAIINAVAPERPGRAIPRALRVGRGRRT